ncbi:hypothetical protein FHG87_003674 [Trinorchestia longiramus]|nr:hypothetical protein FHG87_003674 [Trinorchestia longiramus]
MTDNFSERSLSVIVENKPTLCSSLTLMAWPRTTETARLCVMMKSLHKGPSLMISVELTLAVSRCSVVWQMFY